MSLFSREKTGQDQDAHIEQIICRNYNKYYRMAYSYVHNEADAADIVQEGAYKAIRHSDALRQIAYAETWVYRIMMNEIYRVLRTRKPDCLEEALDQEGYEDSYQNLDLQKALEAMAVKDRTVIQLKYFEDRKLEEIAVILEENVSTVKSRLYRGLKKLRLELEPEAERRFQG